MAQKSSKSHRLLLLQKEKLVFGGAPVAKTINDVYLQLFHRLRDGGDPQPSMTARELTAVACHADRAHTAAWAHSYLDNATVDYANILCDRVLGGEPLAYILGEWDFYGLTFRVDKSVLIPRADTEKLCELTIQQSEAAHFSAYPRPVLRLRLHRHRGGARGRGRARARSRPVRRRAAPDARERTPARRERPSARHEGGRDHAAPGGVGPFDIIVSNPPYITRSEMAQLDHSVADFEPHEALYGGVDGLDFYRAICENWGDTLAHGGILLFECGWKQADAVAEILQKYGFSDVCIEKDDAGVPRIVIGRSPREDDDLTKITS